MMTDKRRNEENRHNMNGDFEERLAEYRYEIANTSRQISVQINTLEQRELRIKIRKNSSKPEYYCVSKNNQAGNGEWEYIPRGSNLPKELAQREYFEAKADELANVLKVIDELAAVTGDLAVDKTFNEMSEFKQPLVKSIVRSDEEFVAAWRAENSFNLNKMTKDVKIFTENGEQVRSKSEKIIADKFKLEGIPYVYEPVIIIDRNICFYPDFAVLNVRTGRSFFYEHFGMMDDPNYVEKTLNKIKEYSNNGFWFGKNLLYTMDFSGKTISEDHLENIIREYLI